ncbi:hypothetical protein KPH14_005789 [Odynerus spinipes]|uniref:Uncharacterized protein n=1 Tax=Odynerus spinipes TaxID=1348599 RepID=A0AAD9RBS3_9HYME|nr:hypothetical protein KPH14_005789 [Odynerus spinipes]
MNGKKPKKCGENQEEKSILHRPGNSRTVADGDKYEPLLGGIARPYHERCLPSRTTRPAFDTIVDGVVGYQSERRCCSVLSSREELKESLVSSLDPSMTFIYRIYDIKNKTGLRRKFLVSRHEEYSRPVDRRLKQPGIGSNRVRAP